MGDTTSGLFVQTTGTSSFVDPTTNKGDIIVRDNSAAVRRAVGSNYSILGANSAETTGLGYLNLFEGQSLWNVGLQVTAAAGALTIALKQQDGSTDATSLSPALIVYRSSTATSGALVTRATTAAASITIPSTATLGMSANVTAILYVYALDNAGTTILGVSQQYFDSVTLQSATAISTGSSSGSVMYASSATTSAACRCIGRIVITVATPGTWVAPNSVSVWPFEIALPRLSTTSATTAVSTTVTVVNPTVLTQQAITYDTSTGVATVLWTGNYLISASIFTSSATWAAGNSLQLALALSGVDNYTLSRRTGAGTYTESFSVSWPLISLNAGNTVALRATTSQAVTLSGTNSTAFSIQYAGRTA